MPMFVTEPKNIHTYGRSNLGRRAKKTGPKAKPGQTAPSSASSSRYVPPTEKVGSKPQRPVEVVRDYSAILGSDARMDQIHALRIQADRLRELSDYLSGQAGLSLPEGAIIGNVKKLRLRMVVDSNRAYKTDRPLFELRRYFDKKRNAWIIVQADKIPAHVAKPGDPDLSPIAQGIAAGYATAEEKAQAIVNFVQTAIEYPKGARLDVDEQGGRMKSPQKTLIDGMGDCKDHVILAASLLVQIGIRPIIINLKPGAGSDAGHVRLGIPGNFAAVPPRYASRGYFPDNTYVHKGKTYYVAEVTINAPSYIGARFAAEKDLGSIEFVQEL